MGVKPTIDTRQVDEVTIGDGNGGYIKLFDGDIKYVHNKLSTFLGLPLLINEDCGNRYGHKAHATVSDRGTTVTYCSGRVYDVT